MTLADRKAYAGSLREEISELVDRLTEKEKALREELAQIAMLECPVQEGSLVLSDGSVWEVCTVYQNPIGRPHVTAWMRTPTGATHSDITELFDNWTLPNGEGPRDGPYRVSYKVKAGYWKGLQKQEWFHTRTEQIAREEELKRGGFAPALSKEEPK